MKKYGSIIMLVVVAALAVVFFATREEPVEKVQAPYSVPAVENLARVELTSAGDDGELIVLEKSGDGWALTKPVEAPVNERVATALDEQLGAKISTDDIDLGKEKLSEYGLGDDALQVALYPQNATSPAAEFQLGKAITVPGTRAKRSYILGSDGEVYRAHTNLGEILSGDVSKLRSKTIQKLEQASVDQIQVSYHEGPTLELVRDGKEWKLKKPEVDFEMEKSQVDALVRNVSNLTAKDFADDVSPTDVGLQPAHATVVTRAGGERHILKVSPFQEESETFYVKKDESPHIYVIAETTGNALTATTTSLRNRLVKEIAPESVERIEFGGDDRIIVRRKGDEWTFARGAKGAVKKTALDARLKTLTKLRAIRFEDVTPEEAGLTSPTAKATIVTEDGRHTIVFGKEADHKGNLYATWDDSDLVMVVSQWVRDRSTPTPEDLTADES